MLNKKPKQIRRDSAVTFDALERRTMFSNIVWTNKGTTTSDTDAFNAQYGSNATLARQNVQRAIDDWETAIVNFNYSGGGNTYNVEIIAAPISGRGQTRNVTHNAGKPNSADITLDDNGGGAGWYFDPIVGPFSAPDDGEFTNAVSLFTADHPSIGGKDFYRTALHELAHAMGISSTSGLLIHNFLTNVADDPNSSDTADRIFSFNVGGGAVEGTFTSSGGLHSYEGPSVLGLPIHPNDLINDGRTIPAGANRRQLISDFILTTFQQAYGYTVLSASERNTFAVNYNSTTDVVTINGDLNPNNNDGDNIAITPVSSSHQFSVNGRFEQISNVAIANIQIKANNANDTVNIDSLPKAVTVTGGTGDDVIIFAGSSSNLDFIDASAVVDGGSGTDIVLFEDDGSTHTLSYDINRSGSTMSFSRLGAGVVTMTGTETHTINGAGGANSFNVNGTQSGTTWTLNGFNGDDVFNVGNAGGNAELVDGAITLNGMVGTDKFNYHDSTATGNPSYALTATQLTRTGNGTVTYGTIESVTVNAATANSITFDDQADTGNDDYTLSPTQIVKTAGATTQTTINFSGVGTMVLNANQGTNVIKINGTAAGMTLTVNDSSNVFNAYWLGGGNIAANLLGAVTLNGAGGSSSNVILDNSLDASPSTQTLNGNTFIEGLSHSFNNVSGVNLLNGSGGGTLDLNRATILTNVTCTSAMTVNVAAGNWQANILANTFVDTLGTVTIDDRLDTGNDTYTVDDHVFRKTTAGTPFISMATNGAPVSLQANNGNNTIQISTANSGTNIRVFANGGNDHIQVIDTQWFFTPQTVSIDTGAEQASAVEPFGDYVTVNSDNDAVVGRAILLGDDMIRRLTVNNAGTFIVPTGVTADVRELIIPGGVIDLAGGALLARPGGSSQAALKTLITRGYNNGAWNGTHASGAINSSLAAGGSPIDAVGYGVGADLGISTIGPFAIAPGDTLLRYTFYGDADLNGVVDFDDYVRIDTGSNANATGWTNGDFNYDNLIDFDDYVLIDSAFNLQ